MKWLIVSAALGELMMGLINHCTAGGVDDLVGHHCSTGRELIIWLIITATLGELMMWLITETLRE